MKPKTFLNLPTIILILAFSLISGCSKKSKGKSFDEQFQLFFITDCARDHFTPGIEGPNPIAEIETVKIGGIDQLMMYRGADKTRPILLILHGGPGVPMIGISRHISSELENHFLVITWEQRGAGKLTGSHIPKETMNIAQFQKDAIEVINYVNKKFNKQKVYLWAQSWGSIMGIYIANDRPDLIHAYIGIGQNVNILKSEQLSYDFVLKKAKENDNKEAIAELEKIGPPKYDSPEEIEIQRKWLEVYGHAYDATIGSVYTSYMAGSGEYKMCEIGKISEALHFSQTSLLDELFTVDITKKVTTLNVPVYILNGRKDYTTNSSLSEQFYNTLNAPKGKKLIWFEEAGHFFTHEFNQEFQNVLINTVLKEVGGN